MEVEKVFLDSIQIGERLRPLDEAKVAVLAESMNAIGLRHPITVWTPDNDQVFLIAGAHRLAAAKLLGWDDILCNFVNLDEIDRRLWEIGENLHRANLTVAQHDEHVAEWVRLVEEKEKVRTVAAPGGRQPREKGQRKAAKELGISEKAVRQAIKVASLAPEAKAVAKEAGLDDNRSALLAAAKHDTAAEQAAELRRKADERARRQAREHAEVKDTKADAREILADAIVEYVPDSRLADVTAALALLGLKEVAARIQSLTGAVFDRTDAGQRIGHA